LWEANAAAIREAITASGIDPKDIAGISFSGHGKGLYALDKDGRPVYNGIASTDTRAWAYEKKWNTDGTADAIYPKICMRPLYMQPSCLLAWLKDHEPEAYSRIRYVFSINDYVRFRMTGEAAADITIASGGGLVNMYTADWDRSLTEAYGIPEIFDALPPLKYSAEVCGTVTAEASEKTLLPEGTPVACGMFDVDACGIASGLSDNSKICMIAGTWSINEFISPEPVLNNPGGLNSIFCIPGYYLLEQSSPTSAGNMEWFVRNLMSYERKEASENGSSVYDLTNKWVEELEPQDDECVFLPFLNGSNEEALARGTFIGLTAYHTKKHMLRAVYEGIVFSHLTHVKRLLLDHEVPSSILLSGGAANSEVWVQIFADALQIPVAAIGGKELGALGAAMSAGIASGVFADYPEAIAKTVQISGVTEPRPEYKEIYEKKYETYRKVIESLAPAWSRFAE
ncbi:MAG: carbohydrate kinase, partial [Eubacterium sp.]|nr:carbohydrate kinase [Eubacterium sp.]